jgi:hypothetical protein
MYHSCRHVVIGGVFQSPPWSKIPELRSLVDQTVDHPCHRRLGPYHPRARPCDRKSPHDSEGAAGRLHWIRGHAEGHFPAHRIASGEGAEAPEYSGRSRVVGHGRGANGSRTNRRFADSVFGGCLCHVGHAGCRQTACGVPFAKGNRGHQNSFAITSTPATIFRTPTASIVRAATSRTMIGEQSSFELRHSRRADGRNRTPVRCKRRGAVAICVGIDFSVISSVTRLPHQAARSMI